MLIAVALHLWNKRLLGDFAKVYDVGQKVNLLFAKEFTGFDL